MRLVHIIAGLNVGGAESFLARLLERLPPRFETSVISLSTIGAIGERLRASGVNVSTLGMTRRSLAPWPILRLRDSQGGDARHRADLDVSCRFPW
jgi:hypothetical protein